jgi:hypothetical protein
VPLDRKPSVGHLCSSMTACLDELYKLQRQDHERSTVFRTTLTVVTPTHVHYFFSHHTPERMRGMEFSSVHVHGECGKDAINILNSRLRPC